MMRSLVALISLCTWTPGFSVNRARRDVTCTDSEYLHAGTCCLNCPAGTFVKQACGVPFTRGACERCDYDTYTEHDNGLLRCLQCSKCHPDQEPVEQCTTTRDTRCQCKAGSFCLPDQACEACRLCSRCNDDEVQTKNCTAHSDATCRKKDATPPSVPTGVAMLIVSGILALVTAAVVVLYRKTSGSWKQAVASCWLTRTGKTSQVGDGFAEVRQNIQGEARVDREAHRPFLPLTRPSDDEEAAPSQTSDVLQATDRGVVPQRCHAQEAEAVRRLVPIDDESLRKSLDLFAQVNVTYHRRFFRKLGLSENDILSTDGMQPEDRMNRLLVTWMQKEGLRADFNHLVLVLLQLEQRLTAENITDRAVTSGYFHYREE